MRIKTIHLILTIVALLLLVMCVYYLLGFPRVFSINKDFDLNSGDIRVYEYICFLKIKDEIQVTPFSQEIRRLSIDIPKERNWITVQTKLLISKYINYPYGGIPADCNFLVAVFDHAKLSDENRRITLQEIISILKRGDRKVPHMINEKVTNEAEKLGFIHEGKN